MSDIVSFLAKNFGWKKYYLPYPADEEWAGSEHK